MKTCGNAANVMCGWLLHSKTYLIRFVHLSEAVMCPAYLRGLDRWPSLSRHCCAIPCRAVDEFRRPSSYQLCGLSCPRHSAEGLDFGGRLMHHHLAGLANSMFLSSQAAARGLNGSLRVSTAQTIRAVLLAMATVATRAGLRSSNDVSHLLARSGCDGVCQTKEVIPTTSSDRMY